MGKLSVKMTLKRALVVYAMLAVVTASLCSIILLRFFGNWKDIIIQSDDGKVNYRTVGGIDYETYGLSKKAERQLKVVEVAEVISIVSCAALSVIVLSCQYYKRKLEHPIYIIKRETKHIAENDLSFDCSYISRDEMGEICSGFNLMRLKLIDNQRQLWRMMEEQRELNAAFAHDIRTPVTVIRGYVQMLIKFQDEGLPPGKQMEILNTILKQTDRMEEFSMTMNKIHSMEEWELKKEEIEFGQLIAHLKLVAGGIKNSNITIDVESRNHEDRISCDINLIQEVADNLISNALRYAKSHICIAAETDGGYLYIYVKDDGKGIDKKIIHNLSKPYFTTEKEHFGLGITICKTLCKKHGGDVELINSIEGGAVATAKFNCSKQIL